MKGIYFFRDLQKPSLKTESPIILFKTISPFLQKVIRGSHLNQSFAQTKLVRVLQGEILDVAVTKILLLWTTFFSVLSGENKN
jgi:dTDP-4-dehydrorhamnose 3,5-epimerase-like enzyme